MSEIERAGAAFGKAIENKMATKDDIAELKGDMRRIEGLTLGLIDAFNANTRSMETALNDAGIPVRLNEAAKAD